MNLLLHTCCGPCAAWPLKTLSEQNVRVTGLFFNPNIYPREEHDKRAAGAVTAYGFYGAPIIINDGYRENARKQYDGDAAGGGSKSGADTSRCEKCYRMRLSHAAGLAAEMNFDAFSTTLLISPYQKHDLIADICGEQSRIYGVRFYYRDFRPHFRDGQKLAREMGLYRQKYCGCASSAPS